MNAELTIAAAFEEALERFSRERPARMLASGELNVHHYIEILRQIYFQARENPQLQALAANYFRGDDRDTVKLFFKHATQEIGHDALAKADLEALGVNTEQLPYEYSLPETAALTGFVTTQIQFRSVHGYLGYLYFLEFLPTSSGAAFATALAAVGVPKSAMTFLLEHSTVDVAHNKLMESYIRRLVHTEDDLRAVVYGVRATGALYAAMLDAAISTVEEPFAYGIDPLEARRCRPDHVRGHGDARSNSLIEEVQAA